LDDHCHHSPLRDSEGQYRCQKCGVCVIPACSSNPETPRIIDDLWERIEPKHESPLDTTWNELEAACVEEDRTKDQRRAKQLSTKGLLPKPRKESRTGWFDRRWPAELKMESATRLVRDDERGTYKLAAPTNDDNPVGRIGGAYGRADKRMQEAIRQASVETVQFFYEKAALTRRERDIFSLWSRDYSQAVIGKQLRISQQAVGKAIVRIKEKLREFVGGMGGEEFLDQVFDRHVRDDSENDLREVTDDRVSRDT